MFVIDLAIEEPPIPFPRDITYCRFPLLDGERNSPALLQSAIDTTAHFVNSKQPTLVACSGGMSRSPIIVSAVLAKIGSNELDAAVERVTATGPCDGYCFGTGEATTIRNVAIGPRNNESRNHRKPLRPLA